MTTMWLWGVNLKSEEQQRDLTSRGVSYDSYAQRINSVGSIINLKEDNDRYKKQFSIMLSFQDILSDIQRR